MSNEPLAVLFCRSKSLLMMPAHGKYLKMPKNSEISPKMDLFCMLVPLILLKKSLNHISTYSGMIDLFNYHFCCTFFHAGSMKSHYNVPKFVKKCKNVTFFDGISSKLHEKGSNKSDRTIKCIIPKS